MGESRTMNREVAKGAKEDAKKCEDELNRQDPGAPGQAAKTRRNS